MVTKWSIMADQLGSLIALLLFFGLVVHLKWEIPIDIGYEQTL